MTSDGLVFLFEREEEEEEGGGKKEVWDNKNKLTSLPHVSVRHVILFPLILLLLLTSVTSPSFLLFVPVCLSLSVSLTSLFLSPLPPSSHLDLIEKVNSPSAIKYSLDSVCVVVCWCVPGKAWQT